RHPADADRCARDGLPDQRAGVLLPAISKGRPGHADAPDPQRHAAEGESAQGTTHRTGTAGEPSRARGEGYPAGETSSPGSRWEDECGGERSGLEEGFRIGPATEAQRKCIELAFPLCLDFPKNGGRGERLIEGRL